MQTPASERRPAFSHDGRWVAYTSDESGLREVYVRPFEMPVSADGGKWRISSGGAGLPMWARNGRELFLVSQNRIMVSDYVVRGRTFVPGKPRLWSDCSRCRGAASTGLMA
jgi:serine/threonine-protein kinase